MGCSIACQKNELAVMPLRVTSSHEAGLLACSQLSPLTRQPLRKSPVLCSSWQQRVDIFLLRMAYRLVCLRLLWVASQERTAWACKALDFLQVDACPCTGT